MNYEPLTINSFLIIQPAFIGDVILTTALAKKLHAFYPNAKIDFLVRKGNESLLVNHPCISEVIVLDKKQNKLGNLFKTALYVRKKKYDCVVNPHRFGSSGFITLLSGAKEKTGFGKNPFSFCYTKKFRHKIGNGKHETERNQQLIAHLTDAVAAKPSLHPTAEDFSTTDVLKGGTYYCIAPASVWFTKQLPAEKWVELISKLDHTVYLLGSPDDAKLCAHIKQLTTNNKQLTLVSLAGKLSLLQTAALMKDAKMNFVNDSAPLHIASAMNAPVTAFFCSTVPAFGFGPLPDKSRVVETAEKLACRPCGLHGHRACPEKHFRCATTITFDFLAP